MPSKDQKSVSIMLPLNTILLIDAAATRAGMTRNRWLRTIIEAVVERR